MMGNASWVDYAQIGLLIIGVWLWFVPKKSGSGPPLKLPLWSLGWWDGVLYLVLGAGVVYLEKEHSISFGGFLLPCIVFFLLREVDRSKYKAPLSCRSLSLGAITHTSLRSFILHWPLLLLVYWAWSMLLPEAEPQGNVQALRDENWQTRAQIAFFAVIVAPLTEELFFRGILYRTLKSLLGAGPAILVTSLAFASAHLNLFAFGPLFALSVFLIIVYERSGHLAVPILYHACFNLLMVIFIIFGNSGT